ncbi:MAG TPA: DUF1569 domain-containing protein [Gemmatimonadaceae bacterium]|nr:DUF1569 domain-containing protein [Gemmatimonadaceae bacterium]
MAKALSETSVREELLSRLERLSPDTKARWGKMNATQMLGHLVDWMSMAEGSLPTAAITGFLRYPPIKQLAIYWLPFPRNVMTAPELLRRKPRDWSVEMETVRQRLESYQSLTARTEWPDHPVFGRMSPRAWCVFGYRHMDHHFRQFGI